jgi:hypothetical protein
MISSKKLNKYFKQQYLSNKNYDKKMYEFFEIKLGRMTMEEYENNFLDFKRYVGFIKYEKLKIQRFLRGFPSFYKNNIEFDEPKTLEDTIRKKKYMYEQEKGRETFHNSWKDKKEKLDYRMK